MHKTDSFIQKNKRLTAIIFVPIGILAVPLIAMLFTKEVNWNFFDFLIMGILLFGTVFSCEFILRKFKTTMQRIFLCGFALLVLLLIWAELAVGVFNSPITGN